MNDVMVDLETMGTGGDALDDAEGHALHLIEVPNDIG